MSKKIRSKQITLDTGLTVTGSLNLSGSAYFRGQTIIEPLTDQQVALIVSGAMNVVDGYVQSVVQNAKVTIGNLGVLGNTSQNESIDLGGFF